MWSCRIVLIVLIFISETGKGEERIVEQIYQGESVTKRDYPYLIRLYIYHNSIFPLCTASLVKNDLALTAGHCCVKSGQKYAVYGDSDQEEFYKIAKDSGEVDVPGFWTYRIVKEYIHPEFEVRRFTVMHDVCMAKLDRPINETAGHSIAKISFNKIYAQECIAVGWGQTEKNAMQFKLYNKMVFAESTYRGNWLIRLYFHAICSGDSGGPLICGGKIYGVASFSTTARCSIPGVDYYAYLREESDFVGKFISSAHSGGSWTVCTAVLILLPLFIR